MIRYGHLRNNFVLISKTMFILRNFIMSALIKKRNDSLVCPHVFVSRYDFPLYAFYQQPGVHSFVETQKRGVTGQRRVADQDRYKWPLACSERAGRLSLENDILLALSLVCLIVAPGSFLLFWFNKIFSGYLYDTSAYVQRIVMILSRCHRANTIHSIHTYIQIL